MHQHTPHLLRHYPALASLLLFVVTQGCGEDPILAEAARQEQAPPVQSGSPSSTNQPTVGIPNQPSPGDPGQPSPGDPGQPSPGDPGQPSPGDPEQPSPGDPGQPSQEEATVAVSGTITAPDWQPGVVLRVDVFDGDQRDLGAPRPSVVGMTRVSEPGPYTVMVSASASAVWVGAYADLDGDGRPDHEEPVGWFAGNPLTPTDGVSGIDLVLAVEAPPPAQE